MVSPRSEDDLAGVRRGQRRDPGRFAAQLRRLGIPAGEVGTPGWEEGDAHLVVVSQDVPHHDLLDTLRRCFVHHWVPDPVRPDEERLWVAVAPAAVADVAAGGVEVSCGSIEVVRLERDGTDCFPALGALGDADLVALMSHVLWDQTASSTVELVDVADEVAQIAAAHEVPWWAVLAFVPDADCVDLHELGVLANAAFGAPAQR